MKRISIIFLLAMITAVHITAEPMILDLQTCTEMALENNPDFRISAISLKTAERNSADSWNSFLPQISAGSGINGDSPVFTGQPGISWKFSGSLNLSLSLNAGIALTIESIGLAYENEQIAYETARMQLKSAVEKEFYYLITSLSKLDIEKANLELAQKNYKQALSNYNHGMISELAVLQTEVSAANLEPAYKQTVAAHKSRINEFLIVIGLEPDTEIQLEGSLETRPVNELDAAKLTAACISNRLDLQALEKNIEKLKNSRALTAVKNKTPTLNLSSGWSINSGQDWSDKFSLGISLNIPLDDFIPGSSTALSIKSLDDQILQAEIRLDKAVNEARTEIINLVAKLDTSAANMKISALNIELAKKTYEMSEAAFARGSIQRLDVEDVQQSYLSAKYQYLAGQYEYLTALIDLRDALNLDSIDQLY